jgi:uncharacterized membrane protein
MIRAPRGWSGPGAALGFALGGFFDGILLHQILQWHHLLSLVPGTADLRTQILWDGYFHLAMYLIAALALWRLWQARALGPSSRHLLASVLIGFGLWHMVDSLLSHWLLGIHRIRLDSPDPLFWDLLWLGLFGIVPALTGLLLIRRAQPTDRPHATVPLVIAGLVTSGAAGWSLQPPPGPRYTTIVMAPQVRPADGLNAALGTGARLVWANPKMSVLVVDRPVDTLPLYRAGALMVSDGALPAGCAAWGRV